MYRTDHKNALLLRSFFCPLRLHLNNIRFPPPSLPPGPDLANRHANSFIAHTESLFAAALVLARGSHRVAVLDAAGTVVNIISQSSVVAFLAHHVRAPSVEFLFFHFPLPSRFWLAFSKSNHSSRHCGEHRHRLVC